MDRTHRGQYIWLSTGPVAAAEPSTSAASPQAGCRSCSLGLARGDAAGSVFCAAVGTEPFSTTVLVSWKVSTLMSLASTGRRPSARSSRRWFRSAASIAAPASPAVRFASSASRPSSCASASSSAAAFASRGVLPPLASAASCLTPRAVLSHAIACQRRTTAPPSERAIRYEPVSQ